MTTLVTISEQKTGDAPPTCGGGWQLDAERSWVIDGPKGAIDEIQHALPASLTFRVGGALLVRFGNAVGCFDVPHIGRLQVHTGKWTELDFDSMLEDIAHISAALPFAAREGGSLPYDRSFAKQDEVLYHAFVYLRHALASRSPASRPLLPALRAVLADPHRVLVQTRHRVPMGLAGRVDPNDALQASMGRLDRAPPGHRSVLSRQLKGHLPPEVHEGRTRPEFDVPENRFVKAFLDLAEAVVEGVRAKAGELPAFAARLRAQCDQIERALRPIRQHGLWSEVGRMQRFPASSTVLQRRRGYRCVLHHYLRLRLATRMPLSPVEALHLLEIKDIATLYETWTYLQVVEHIQALLGESPMVASLTEPSTWQTGLPRGARVAWADGTEVFYNLSFSRTKKGAHNSYSLTLRPDIALHVPHGPNAGLHVLDAKFKLQTSSAQGNRDDLDDVLVSSNPADIHKMHAYRDALPEVRSAWALYPGDAFAFFGETSGKATSESDLPANCAGVGVVPLRALASKIAISQVLSRLLGCSR